MSDRYIVNMLVSVNLLADGFDDAADKAIDMLCFNDNYYDPNVMAENGHMDVMEVKREEYFYE